MTPTRLLRIGLGAIAAASLAGCGAAPYADGLKVEISHGTPGFSSPTSDHDAPGYDPNDVRYEGFDNDLVNAIAKGLDDVPVVSVGNGAELRNIASDLNPRGGQKAQALIAVATISDTVQRREGRDDNPKMTFAGVYMKSPLSFLVRKNDPQTAKLLTDLEHPKDSDADRRRASNAFVFNPDEPDKTKWDRLKVCVKESSTAARTHIADGGGVVEVAPTTENCVTAMNQGIYDAVVTDDILLQAFACTGTTDTGKPYHCDAETAAASPWTIVGRKIFPGTEWYGVAIQPSQHDACTRIEELVQKYVQDTATWKQSFNAEFPVLQDGANVNDYLPTPQDSRGRSCDAGQ